MHASDVPGFPKSCTARTRTPSRSSRGCERSTALTASLSRRGCGRRPPRWCAPRCPARRTLPDRACFTGAPCRPWARAPRSSAPARPTCPLPMKPRSRSKHSVIVSTAIPTSASRAFTARWPSSTNLDGAHSIIVVAGMEGALPSVVAGLVQPPIIAVPTSVGYGAARDGFTALFTMLSSCAPGIAVVNIDNGFGAAAVAHKIAMARIAPRAIRLSRPSAARCRGCAGRPWR